MRRTGAEADAEPPACFVCMDAAADAVLIECGHGGLCAGAPPTLTPAHLKEELFPHNLHVGVWAESHGMRIRANLLR